MNLYDLVQKYRNQLKQNPHDYTCLLFALQLPSVCGRIEFPPTAENKTPGDKQLYISDTKPLDSKIYKKWLKKHIDCFQDIYKTAMTCNEFCDLLYAFRCQLTHEGVLMTNKSNFYFIDSTSAMAIGDTVFIPMERLCRDMFDAVSSLSYELRLPDITPFDDLLISSDIFSHIQNDVDDIYAGFWKNYTDTDHFLNLIYTKLLFDNEKKQNEIAEFFRNDPNGVFEEIDFCRKHGVSHDAPFIHKKRNEKSDIRRVFKQDTYVLRLNKQQYERMIQVHKELEDFAHKHEFDIKKYL